MLSLLGCLPAPALAALIWSREGSAAGLAAGGAALLALLTRALLVFWARLLEIRNHEFASDLRAALPSKAIFYVDSDIESELERERIEEGAILRVLPQQTVPADGFVTFGSSFVDESLFGSPEPVPVGMGSQVHAGARNGNGTFLVRVTAKVSAAEALAKSLESGARTAGPRSVVVLDLLLFACLLFGFFQGLSLQSLLAVSLAAGGAALAASLSMRDSSLQVRSAASGMVWNSWEAVTEIARMGAIVSGGHCVLLERKRRLSAFAGSLGEAALLRFLAPLARRLESPEAFALLLEARLRNVPLEAVDDSDGIPRIDGDAVEWVEDDRSLELGPLAEFARARRGLGETLVFLRLNGALAGGVSFQAPPLASARHSLDMLRQEDMPFVLATTASKSSADHLAHDFELHHVHAEADEKSLTLLLDKLRGDGLNPALVRCGELARSESSGLVFAEIGDMFPASVRLLRLDLQAVLRAWVLARRYAVSGQWATLTALLTQIAIPAAGLSSFSAAIAGALAALVVVALSYRLRLTSLDHG